MDDESAVAATVDDGMATAATPTELEVERYTVTPDLTRKRTDERSIEIHISAASAVEDVMDRRQSLEVVAGGFLAVTAGCLGNADGPSASTATTGRPTVETTTGTTTAEVTTELVRAAPSVAFTFDYGKDDGGNRVSITHAGGDSLAGNRVRVTVEGTVAFEEGDVVTSNYRAVTDEWNETVTSGDTLAVRAGAGTEITEWQTVEIEWSPERAEDSVLVARSDVRF